MGTVADKLNKLLSTKADIRAAITEKGQVVADSDTFASYAEKIRAIKSSKIPCRKSSEAETPYSLSQDNMAKAVTPDHSALSGYMYSKECNFCL